METDKLKIRYMTKLNNFKETCDLINNTDELKQLFKGVFEMLINHIFQLKENIFKKYDNINKKLLEEKISRLNILIELMESNKVVIDILIRGYILYFYKKYRDVINNWQIELIVNIEEIQLKKEKMSIAQEEEVVNSVEEYMNIFSEIYLILKYLELKDVMQIFYILNNY